MLADLVTIVEGEESDHVLLTIESAHVWIVILLAVVGVGTLIWLARRKWPFITVLLYTCWITIIFIPLILFLGMVLGGTGEPEINDVQDTLWTLYTNVWSFWIFCGAMIISQILLLMLPIKIIKQRPIPQRSIWSTAIGAAAFFALIIVGIALSVGAAILGDDILEAVPFGAVLVFLLYNWVLWAWIFRGFARNADAHSHVLRLTRWLLRGSILELLVAVPSHIIVRHKDVCCAHGVTALGIATGLAVMLISFGPGIYFLYAQRIESKNPRAVQIVQN